VFGKSGGALANATVNATDAETGFSQSTHTNGAGDYEILRLPSGTYKISVEAPSFQPQSCVLSLVIGQAASLDFTLVSGAAQESASAISEASPADVTRTSVDAVIGEEEIRKLPLNGRRFIDFVLLAPGVTVGNSTSGTTDVPSEPVTKLSFAGQNVHDNFVSVDGADNISTASGLQKTAPSEEAVREFRVINSTSSVETGRAVGGTVNVITKSGSNNVHGALYEYLGNNAFDATSELAAPGLTKLQHNQFGLTLGGPFQKDRTFYFVSYEGQRRNESPYYNSVILANLAAINQFKTNLGLAGEQLDVTRQSDYDGFLVKLDNSFSQSERASFRYFLNDGRLTNVSPLNDGFDLPSSFKDNFLRDQSVVGSLNSFLSADLNNELRVQYAHRSFDFPTDTTQPHLEVLSAFAMGANRGNPDSYQEGRVEIADNVIWLKGKHTLAFGGDFNYVSTTESFPLFFPLEADFGCLFATQCPFSLQAAAPEVFYFERFKAPTFTEPSFNASVFSGQRIPSSVSNQAKGTIGHTYAGFYLQDSWRANANLTLNYGLRYQLETFPSQALNDQVKQFDPRAGFAYNFGTKYNIVVRGGGGLFHGIIPMSLLACQQPSCGGTAGPYPGRPNEDALNATTRLFAFFSAPNITSIALTDILAGTYPDAAPLGFCPGGTVSGCGFFGDVVTGRFEQNHQVPYSIQVSLGLALQPTKDSTLEISVLRSQGVHLGSFFNVNQPDATGQVMVHNSEGQAGLKNTYFAAPGIPGSRSAAPGFPVLYAVYLEGASRWNSEWNGLLVNFNKRMSYHFSAGVSYTWSKGIDDGPNPSFVLIPQDSANLRAEHAISSDSVGQRCVLNAVVEGPTHVNTLVNNFRLATIVTLESPHYFTKFAGFDANGDILSNNDRVGIDPRNTFQGDSYQSIDLRLARTFKPTEKLSVEAMAEAFNLFNTVNVRLFNTVYGAADFCPFNPVAQGCSATQHFLEGSPNPDYGIPRAVSNPRQIQFAVRISF
jgi:hypothetical protein